MTQVLIVDDDDDTRATLRYLLEDAGYGVLEAPGVPEALSQLQEEPERLVVLLDYLLPGLDGAALLEDNAAWQADGSRHTYLLLTASPQKISPALQERLLELHVPVLPKPFDINDILQFVKQSAQLAPDRLDDGFPSL